MAAHSVVWNGFFYWPMPFAGITLSDQSEFMLKLKHGYKHWRRASCCWICLEKSANFFAKQAMNP